MELTPRERDKSLIFTAALLADRTMARGVKLDHPQAVAYSAAILEGAHDVRTVAESVSHGATLPTPLSPARDGGTLTLSFEDRHR